LGSENGVELITEEAYGYHPTTSGRKKKEKLKEIDNHTF